MKQFDCFFSDIDSHKVILNIKIKADGYLTALAEASKICKEHYPNLYVSRVV